MKTIKNIADEIGVSKTAIFKQIDNLGLRKSLRKNGNQFMVDEKQEELIKAKFAVKTQTESQTIAKTVNPEVYDDIVSVLKETISTLQGQLEIKDKQIEQLNEALLNAQNSAAAAQALHAGTIKQQLTSGDEDPLNDTSEPYQKEDSFWHRLFKKK